MKYTLSKSLATLAVLLVTLYGMGLLSILTQNEGRKLSNEVDIKDYGFELMSNIDTNDRYIKEEMIDYHLDEVAVLLMIVYGLVLNLCYNQGQRYKFFVEWFMLLSILYTMRIFGMILTIIPSPKNDIGGTCNINYKFENTVDIFLDAIKIYVYRDRVCYDLVFEADLINTTLLGLLLLKYFKHWSVKVKVVFLWLLNVFIVMMMRMTYTMNVYLSIVVTCLLFVVFYYETKFNVGLMGVVLKEDELLEDVVFEHVDSIEEDVVEISIIDEPVVVDKSVDELVVDEDVELVDELVDDELVDELVDVELVELPEVEDLDMNDIEMDIR